MPAKVRILRASNAGSVAPTLDEGELAVNALAEPAELWTGVPTSRDPTGRINLLSVVSIGPNPPASARIGTLWFDSNDLQMYILFNDGTTSQWVPVNAQ